MARFPTWDQTAARLSLAGDQVPSPGSRAVATFTFAVPVGAVGATRRALALAQNRQAPVNLPGQIVVLLRSGFRVEQVRPLFSFGHA